MLEWLHPGLRSLLGLSAAVRVRKRVRFDEFGYCNARGSELSYVYDLRELDNRLGIRDEPITIYDECEIVALRLARGVYILLENGTVEQLVSGSETPVRVSEEEWLQEHQQLDRYFEPVEAPVDLIS